MKVADFRKQARGSQCFPGNMKKDNFEYTEKVDAALGGIVGEINTPEDFCAIAMACLDQAGLPVPAQTTVRKIIEQSLRIVVSS